MPNAEHCMAMADEADRLATIVSYGRDKARLKQQAETWREQAKAMEAERAAARQTMAPEAATTHRGVMDWLRRRH